MARNATTAIAHATAITFAATNVDAVNNQVSGYITVYKHHFLASDEVATYNLL